MHDRRKRELVHLLLDRLDDAKIVVAEARNLDTGRCVELTLSADIEIEGVVSSHYQLWALDILRPLSPDQDLLQELFVSGRNFGKELDRVSSLICGLDSLRLTLLTATK